MPSEENNTNVHITIDVKLNMFAVTGVLLDQKPSKTQPVFTGRL